MVRNAGHLCQLSEARIPITGMMCLQTFRKASVSGVPSGPFTFCSRLVICTNSELDMSACVL